MWVMWRVDSTWSSQACNFGVPEWLAKSSAAVLQSDMRDMTCYDCMLRHALAHLFKAKRKVEAHLHDIIWAFAKCAMLQPRCHSWLQHDRQCVAATATVIQTHNLTCPRSAVLQSDMHDMTSMHAILPTAFWLTARRVCVCVLCDFCWTQPRGSHVASLCTCVSHALWTACAI